MHTTLKINCLGVSLLLLTACGGGSSSGSAPTYQSNTYATTSSKGDYSEWTINGDHLDAMWETVDPDGAIQYTTIVAATCGTPDSYGLRSCTVDSSSCTDGTGTCPTSPASDFSIREVPGVALFAKVGTDTQLHVGLAKDSNACNEDVSGDYTMVHTGLDLPQIFGMYRSDANFNNILQSDFGFDAADATSTQFTTYLTSSEAEAFTDEGCVDGVRTRKRSDGSTIRSMITSSGLFVLDLPSGKGGAVAFNVANAASLSDFANKSFSGIAFDDTGSPIYVNADFNTVNSGKVDFNVKLNDGTTEQTGTESLLSLTTAATVSSPSYADFSVAPAGYESSTLATSYATPKNIPGLFKLDGPLDVTRLVLAAMKYNGKVIIVGLGYNYRKDTDISPATGMAYPAAGIYSSGNFLLFEK